MDAIERKPILETIKKHGASKLFLLATSLTLLGAVVKCGYEIIVSVIRMVNAKPNSDYTGYIVTASAAAIALVFAFLVFYGLFSSYRYFKGRTDSGLKLNFTVKMLGLSYLAESIFFFIEIRTQGGDDAMITFGIIIAVALALLYIAFYRGLKVSVEYPEHAMENSPRGRISGFIIGTLLTVLIIYLAITAVQLFFGIRAIFSTPIEGMEADRAKGISDAISKLIGLAVLAPSMAGYAYFLKLIKLFRHDMNVSREEWAEIERKAKRSGL